ncbi:MAG TPA: helix-turn-helix domain-containing GNAT family N-acetyltransferase [Gemmatimonadales bacterium]|nr:helix-turn-helix domain-containing GNAT family N-acetyltransferase [Gemmatimonadales bacterium]
MVARAATRSVPAESPETAPEAVRVRRFNRFYTRQMGLLHANHLQTGFSLPEGRVMYELAHMPRPTAAAIGGALGLDRGYLSRLLRTLRRRGLVTARPDPEDRRHRVLALTAKGRRAFARLDSRATSDVATQLTRLSAAERERLVAAMETVTALLEPEVGGDSQALELRAPIPGDLGWVVQRHAELYAAEYGWDEDCERLVAQVVGEFAAAPADAGPGSRQRCWIATLGGRRAGSVFLMPGPEGVGRLRLLLVEPWARGHGVGGRLVDACVAQARQAGCHTLTLWTNDVLTAARRLYQRAGFRLISSERHHSFGRDLTGQTWELALRGPPGG